MNNNPIHVNDLKNKIVVISGGAGVICRTLALAIANEGAKVMILDINYSKTKEVEDEINALGLVSKAYMCNCLDKDSIKNCHNEITKDFGKIDILINGAGGNSPKATCGEYASKEMIDDFFSLDISGFDKVFDLNFKSALLMSQEFSCDMVNKKGCSILNISSMNAFIPLTKIPAYSSAKAALTNFTEWLSVHFSKLGIRVNAIAPGFLITEQNKELLFNSDGTYTDRSKKIISSTPMERFGEPNELVAATLMLISEEASSFINGVILPIDGGFSKYSGV